MFRKKYYDKVQELKGNIRVLCRIRPLNKSEKERVSHGVIYPLSTPFTVSKTNGRKFDMKLLLWYCNSNREI